MANLSDIFNWFSIGKTPTAEQFKQSWSSFWHKSEKIAISVIFGLQDALNDKASKEDLENVTTKFKGYYTNLSDLQEAYPQPENKKDWFAWVGSPYPGTVWKVNADVAEWVDTGEIPTQQEIDLAEYAKQDDLLQVESKINYTKLFEDRIYSESQITLMRKFISVAVYTNNPNTIEITVQRYSNVDNHIQLYGWNAAGTYTEIFTLNASHIISQSNGIAKYRNITDTYAVEIEAYIPDKNYIATGTKSVYRFNFSPQKYIEWATYKDAQTLFGYVFASRTPLAVSGWKDDVYISPAGVEGTATNWSRTTAIAVKSGTAYLIYTWATTTMAAVVAVSSGNTPLQVLSIGKNLAAPPTRKLYIVKIPENVEYISIGTHSPQKNNVQVFEAAEMMSEVANEVRTQENKFVLPAYLDCPIGRNTDLFLDALIMEPDTEKTGALLITGTSSAIWRGTNIIRYAPSAAANDITLTFNRTDANLNSLYSKQMKLRAVPRNTGNGTEERNICLCGDSLVADGNSAAECFALLHEDGDYIINQLGTFSNAGAKHEGRASWTWAAYVNPAYENTVYYGKTNAFMYNGALDFKHYVEVNFPELTRKTIDVFFIALNTNDVTQGTSLVIPTKLNEIVASAKTFINAFLRDFPDSKLIIGLPGIGAITARNLSANAAVFCRSIQLANQRLIAEFDNGKYHANVTTVAHGAFIDRYGGYPYVDAPANDYSDTVVRSWTNTVHPNTNGYRQWGRGIYSKIRAVLSGYL